MDYAVRFFSLANGSVATVREEKFTSLVAAQEAATAHATAAGFTRVKFVSDDDYATRVTATTPGGRAGRNVAVIEPHADFSQEGA